MSALAGLDSVLNEPTSALSYATRVTLEQVRTKFIMERAEVEREQEKIGIQALSSLQEREASVGHLEGLQTELEAMKNMVAKLEAEASKKLAEDKAVAVVSMEASSSPPLSVESAEKVLEVEVEGFDERKRVIMRSLGADIYTDKSPKVYALEYLPNHDCNDEQ